jgi:hypothetical protein
MCFSMCFSQSAAMRAFLFPNRCWRLSLRPTREMLRALDDTHEEPKSNVRPISICLEKHTTFKTSQGLSCTRFRPAVRLIEREFWAKTSSPTTKIQDVSAQNSRFDELPSKTSHKSPLCSLEGDCFSCANTHGGVIRGYSIITWPLLQ